MAYVPFTQTFDIESATVYADNLEHVSSQQLDEVREAVNTFGFAVVDRPRAYDPEKQILALGRHFGNVVMHDKSQANGVTTVRSKKDALYLSQSSAEHDFHTDCTYMHIGFAKAVLLQCVKLCPHGGDSLLFSGLNGYAFLEKNHPSALRALQSGKIKFKRGHSVGERPVFSEGLVGPGRVAFTYRRDSVSELSFPSEETEKSYDILTNYMKRPENLLQFKLQENQVLVVDNLAVAHGRTAYSPDSGRTMHRLQLDGEGPGLVLGMVIRKSDQRDVFYRDAVAASLVAVRGVRKSR